MPNTVLNKHFQGRRVLVTGHTGFKGSWFTMWMRTLGADVRGFALQPDTEPSLFELAGVGEGISHNVADIRNSAAVQHEVMSGEPEFVFHFAAQPLVRLSYEEPAQTFETNVMGLVNLLEAVRQSDSVKVVVVITSDKCYENREWVWGYRECDPLGGRDPYSASKAAAEIVASSYRRSFFADGDGRSPKLVTARAGNVLGGGDFATDRIIPDAVRAVQKNEPLRVRQPHSVRPWQHVLEALSGYLAVAMRVSESEAPICDAWNFGPHHGGIATVETLVTRFLETLGKGEYEDVSGDLAKEPHEAQMLWLNCDRAHLELDWQPTLSTKRAIDITAAWYRRVLLEGKDARTECEAEIADFALAAREAGYWWAQ